MELNKLYEILQKSWCKETCYELLQDEWTKENSALGQCFVMALVVNDFFGGEILKGKVSDNTSHYWNLIDGRGVDFTKSQFSKENKVISKPIKVSRESLKEIDRYLLLKSKVQNLTF